MKRMCLSIGVVALVLALAGGAGAVDEKGSAGKRTIETVRPTGTPEPDPDPFKAPDRATAQAICDAVSKKTGFDCEAVWSGGGPEDALKDYLCKCQ